MGNKWINHYFFTGLIIIGHLQFWGCSFLLTPEYPDPILLNEEPNVLIRYQYKNVHLTIPTRILEGNPTAFHLGVYDRTDPESPLMEKVFFHGDSIVVTLPQDIFSKEELGNLAVLTPLSGDFEIIKQFFTIRGSGDLVLPISPIRYTPAVLKGIVIRRKDNQPVKEAIVILNDSAGAVDHLETDSLGSFNFRLWSHYKDRKDLTLIVSTAGKFSTWKQHIDFGGAKLVQLTVPLGPSDQFLLQGMTYRVMQDRTPLREGPENGSPIQFLLSKGDVFVVEKVAGDRLYGFIEIWNYETDVRQQFDGWVRQRYLELLQ